MCQRCNSNRLLRVSAKSGDCNALEFHNNNTIHDYVPYDLGLGGGDYVKFTVCLDCGQMQGEFPLPPAESLEEE
jgi:hypothetical protein